MRGPAAALAILAFLALAAGCLQPPAGFAVPGAADPAAAAPPQGENAGSAESHGTPRREESPVLVTQEGNRYVARRNVTVGNDFGGASTARLLAKTENGAVAASAWDDGGYRLVALLEARAVTEQAARDALATLEVGHTDRLSGSHLGLSFEVRFGDLGPLALPFTIADPPQRGAAIQARLPPEPALALEASATNGAILARGLHGPSLQASSSNGAVVADGAWGRAELRTTNGAITLHGTFNEVRAETTNGGIAGDVVARGVARHAAETTNGPITWEVAARDEQGYSADASTTNGMVSVRMPGVASAGTSSFRGSTPGYEDQAERLEMSLRSSNGAITVSVR